MSRNKNDWEAIAAQQEEELRKKNETKSQEDQIHKETPQTFVVKTELDAYIHDRVQTQPQTLEQIKVREVVSPLENKHALTLPKDIKEALDSKGMVGYWINKKKRAIDRALNDRGWVLFTRVYFPNISRHYFTANGTVEIGDCILGFMPKKNAERLRQIPGELSQERVKNLPIDKHKDANQGEKINYYKPALTPEKDGEMVTVGLQPDMKQTEE